MNIRIEFNKIKTFCMNIITHIEKSSIQKHIHKQFIYNTEKVQISAEQFSKMPIFGGVGRR